MYIYTWVYKWIVDEFVPFECPSICGQESSIKTRNVQCYGTDGEIYNNDYCDETNKPKDIETCPVTVKCGI